MKNILIFLTLLSFLKGFSQTETENYVKHTAYKVEVPIQYIDNVSDQNKIESITYYDGLGRVKQNIAVAAGGNGQDIITPVFYDSFNRQAQQYLPYSDPSQLTSSLNYRDNANLRNSINSSYNTKFPGELNTSNYNVYSETFFESSPLNRPLKQGAPGKDWRCIPGSNSDHTMKYEYECNGKMEVRKFRVNFPDPSNTEMPSLGLVSLLYKENYYKTSQLFKTISKDENWSPSNCKNRTSEQFTDKFGRTILQRTYNSDTPCNSSSENPHDTYYIYDKFGNLTYVIPPLATEQIIKASIYIPPFAALTFPWVKLAKVDQKLAEEYEKELGDYENKDILNLDLIDKYGGQGGFSIIPSGSDGIIINFNVTTTQPLPLQTGIIADLKDLGKFQDKEQGKISGPGFEYFFLIRDNKLVVDGYGDVPSIYLNTSLTGEQPLSYAKNYPWTKIVKGDDKIAADYEKAIAILDNSEILTTYTDNLYNATGGISISLDEDDNLTVSINVNINTTLELKNGTLFPLDIERRLPDGVIGRIQGSGYDYEFSIYDNSLSVKGFGFLNNFTFWNNRRMITNESIRQEAIEGLCYIYHYDSRNRVIEKNIPGKGWEYIVYDKLDRPILTQDQNLRSINTWIFTKYDALGRVVYTGQIVDPASRKDLQNELDGVVNPILWENRTTTPFLNSGTTVHYTNDAFPKDDISLLTVNYYDDYNFEKAGLPFDTTDTFGHTFNTNVKGLSTGGKVRVLDLADTKKWITNITRYDSKGRIIWTGSKNEYLNNSETIENLSLNFTGNVLYSKVTHRKDGFSELTIYNAYEYDRMNRLKKHNQAQTPLWGTTGTYSHVICSNEYNEFGQLIRKNVGGKTTNPTQLQVIDYTYNIRGWLKGINNIDSDFSLSAEKDLFALELNYNTIDLPSSVALYDGNISEMHWKTKTGNYGKRSYKLQYDAFNRLTLATYHKYNYPIVGTAAEYEDYTEGPITYDKNGNIMSLKRYGLHGANDITIIDDLTYKYMPYSNKLLKITDAANYTEGFNDGGTGDMDDYEYDNNGNVKKDMNKGMGAETYATYNYLNLPKAMVLPEGNINFTYDAAGNKLEKKVTKISGEIIVTQYDGEFIYEKAGILANVLKFFAHPEGYVMINGAYTADNFKYIYQYKDHLGNIRLSYRDVNNDGNISNSEIIEEDNYYPFGLKQMGYNNYYLSIGEPKADKYDYNAKEMINDLELNNYDYGWRQYDPAIGRFFKVDRFAEKYYPMSTYQYAANNPIRFIDVNGDYIGEGQDIVNRYRNDLMQIQSEITRARMAEIREAATNGTYAKVMEKHANTTSNESKKLSHTNAALQELEQLEKSTQRYDIVLNSSLSPSTSGGSFTYDINNNTMHIGLIGGYDFGDLAHEMKHAYQFETGHLAFRRLISGDIVPYLYDLNDEYEAFDRGGALGGMSRSKGSIQKAPGYEKLGPGPISLNTIDKSSSQKATYGSRMLQANTDFKNAGKVQIYYFKTTLNQ